MRSEKRVLGVMVFIVIALFCSLVVGNAAAQVKGGKHDLSMSGTSNFQHDTFEVCVFCHTPHGSNTNQSYRLNPATDNLATPAALALNGQFLWNRKTPTPSSWQTYSSNTMNHSAASGPGKLSLLCLSCHDGVGAMNVLINNPSAGQPQPISSLYNQFGDASITDPNIGPLNIGEGVCDGGLGTACSTEGNDLRNDHPIGFPYLPNASAVDPGLYDLNAIQNPDVLERMQKITGGRMECSSCHDPHMTNTGNPGNMFLVTLDNSGSKLCFACHNK